MILYEAARLMRPRQLLTWALLAFSAGGVNAIAIAACERFVTHVTGTLTLLGSDIRQLLLVFDYAVVVACFVLGAMFSVLLIDGRHHRGKVPFHWAPLTLVAAVLALVAGMGVAGHFGPFGGELAQPSFLLLSFVSFAMGLQNAAVATATAMAVRTTHMTGPATDLGVSMGTWFYAIGEERAKAGRITLLRMCKLCAFAAGAVVMMPLSARLEYATFLIPAGLSIAAMALSFAPWQLARLARDGAARASSVASRRTGDAIAPGALGVGEGDRSDQPV